MEKHLTTRPVCSQRRSRPSFNITGRCVNITTICIHAHYAHTCICVYMFGTRFGTGQQLAKLDLHVYLPLLLTSPISSSRLLFVTMELHWITDYIGSPWITEEITFAPHIHGLCRDSCYQLRQLRTVVRFLSPPPEQRVFFLQAS